MRHIFLLLSAIAILTSCETKPAPDNTLALAQEQLKTDASPENMKSYFSALDSYIKNNKADKAGLLPKIEEGAQTALANNKYGKASGYLLSLLRLDKNNTSRNQNLAQLANCLNEMKRTYAAKVLYKSYKDNGGNAPEFSGLERILDDEVSDIPGLLNRSVDSMFVNPDEQGLNKVNAQKYVDLAEAFALGSPQHPDVPGHLYKAAETARSLRTIPKALNIYDWVIEDYPNYDKTPTVLFLKGFVIENELKNSEEAGKIYQEFLKKYPKHEMAESVQFLIENLGKTDDEILEIIENKRQDKPSK